MQEYEAVSRIHFLNDVDEVKRYIRAYLDGAKVNENELYPIMGEYIIAFGELLGNEKIRMLGNWISQAAIYKLPIVLEYKFSPTERFTYDQYTKKVIFRQLYPVLDFFHRFYILEGMTVEEAVLSVNRRLAGNIEELEKIVKYILPEQLAYFNKQKMISLLKSEQSLMD